MQRCWLAFAVCASALACGGEADAPRTWTPPLRHLAMSPDGTIIVGTEKAVYGGKALVPGRLVRLGVGSPDRHVLAPWGSFDDVAVGTGADVFFTDDRSIARARTDRSIVDHLLVGTCERTVLAVDPRGALLVRRHHGAGQRAPRADHPREPANPARTDRLGVSTDRR